MPFNFVGLALIKITGHFSYVMQKLFVGIVSAFILLMCMLMGLFAAIGFCSIVWGSSILSTALGTPPQLTHPAFITFLLVMIPGMLIGAFGALYVIRRLRNRFQNFERGIQDIEKLFRSPDLTIRRWHRAIIADAEKKLGRPLESYEREMITSRGGFVALEIIHDTIKALDQKELESYLSSEKKAEAN
jgi:hypothetical protein